MNTRSLTLSPRRNPFSVLGVVLFCLQIWQERRALAKLDDAALADIGLTRGQVKAEVNKPIWDAPNRWVR